MSDREIPASDPDEVAEWLAAQGPELAMPAPVARRVHETLAREAAARSADTQTAGTSTAGTRSGQVEADVLPLAGRQPSGRPLDRPSTRRRGSRWLVAASVAALAVLGSAVVVPLVNQGGEDSAAETTAIGGNGTDTLDDSAAADSATSGGSRVQAVPEGGSGLDEDAESSVLPGVPADLLDEVGDPEATRAPAGCGARLADEVGAEVLAAVLAPDDAGVLVATRDSAEDAVWWLPSCSAMAADARARSIVG